MSFLRTTEIFENVILMRLEVFFDQVREIFLQNKKSFLSDNYDGFRENVEFAILLYHFSRLKNWIE